ncbi:MAG TPA: hypothetical protein VMV18_04980 [bacterium]|nr:hypothetical protein [bacterium]
MRGRSIVLIVAAAFAAAVGCHSGKRGGGEGGVAALFEVPRPGVTADFYALPFPNDVRVDSDGTVSLAGHPRPTALTDTYLNAIDARQVGFGLAEPIFFLFDGVLEAPDPSLDTTALDAPVYLVDIDPASPAKGTRIPIVTRFETAARATIPANRLVVLPYPGFVLREGTTYAAVVTTRLGVVHREPDFNVVLGDTASGIPELEAARTLYAPLRAWLDEAGGDSRDDVVSAAVFTTGTPTATLARAREVVRALPAPVASGVALVNQLSGFDVWEGAYDAPNFQTGAVPYLSSGGEIVLGSAGAPVVQRTEPMRFAFSVPPGPKPASGWPVVIYQHGTGGDYRTFVDDGTASRLAAQGLAVISTDEVLHGARNPGGDPVADVVNLANPLSLRDNARQGAIDDFSLVRLAEGLAASSGGITFDPSRVEFMGHNLGGNTGALALADEADVKGAVLSGAGGGLVRSMLGRTQPTALSPALAQLTGEATVDEFDPVMGLLQAWLDPADPAAYARYLVTEPRASAAPKNVFEVEGLSDHYTPNAALETLAVALGLDQVSPVLAPISGVTMNGGTVLTPPVAGNQSGVTAVVLQYPPAAGSDGDLVAFDVAAAQTQHASFLGTLAATGTATVVVAP